MPALFILVAGLAAILAGAQLLVEGSLGLARKYRIPEMIIGLTVLTIGTSVPELTISLVGAINKTAGTTVSSLILGQIVGSGIANIGLILGLAGLFGSFKMGRRFLTMQTFFFVGAVLLMIAFGQDGFFTRIEGLVMLGFYGGYMMLLPAYIDKRHLPETTKTVSFVKSASWVVLGLITVVVSAQVIVNAGIQVAASLGVNQSLVGLFLIGVGTSFPELIVSLTAAFKKAPGLSVGNIIGSNVFNVLVALGGSSAISGLVATKQLVNQDMTFLLVVSMILMAFFFTKKKLEPRESFLLVALYLGYAMWKLVMVV